MNPSTSHAADLEALCGLKGQELRINLSKEELFHEAIANDRGRVTEGGPNDAQKAFSTALGTDGPLVYYTDPTCTGRPVKDTFGVAWPEFEDTVWWKPDFQKFRPEKFEALLARVVDHLNKQGNHLYVKDVNFFELVQFFFLLLVMRKRVVWIGYANLWIGTVANFFTHHESNNTSHVSPISERL